MAVRPTGTLDTPVQTQETDMHDEQPQKDVSAQMDGTTTGDGRLGRSRMSRRQAMGRLSVVAGAGAAAWVVPEILTAKPAAGAALSGTNGSVGASAGVTTSASTGGDPGAGASVDAGGSVSANGPEGISTDADTTAATDPSGALAFTGLNIQRDASVGAALVAGGWAMQHWASRRPKPGLAGTSDAGQAGSAGGGT
ncbi:MAG TPA: hypothetical protein VH012_00885 [Acidimicrobiales bacterium]|jgi:hypothetical protein|nr:hypothetical protein [Acidimicrobiales bacterium]